MNKFEQERLDKLNTERVERTKQRVAHAIVLIDNPIKCFVEGHGPKDIVAVVSHAINLLESAVEEMTWACDHFDWNDSVVDQMKAAIGDLGAGVAAVIRNDDDDTVEAELNFLSGRETLGMVIATLVRWFDDNQDVSEL